MSEWKEKWESAASEPHLQPGQRYRADPSEQKASRPSRESELEHLRDSVRSEPSLRGAEASTGDRGQRFGAWLQSRVRATSYAVSFFCVLLAGLAGGGFAVLGAFLIYLVTPTASDIEAVSIVIIAPVSEEILKQLGIIYLLEFKPYRVRARWQIFLAGFLAALVFASLENLIYTNVYVQPEDVRDFAAFVQFRWIVCTSLHVLCTLITSIGLGLVWERLHRRHETMDLQVAYPFFLVAMVLHGAYNFSALMVEAIFNPF